MKKIQGGAEETYVFQSHIYNQVFKTKNLQLHQIKVICMQFGNLCTLIGSKNDFTQMMSSLLDRNSEPFLKALPHPLLNSTQKVSVALN